MVKLLVFRQILLFLATFVMVAVSVEFILRIEVLFLTLFIIGSIFHAIYLGTLLKYETQDEEVEG